MPKASTFRNSTIPIFRGAVKSKYLKKHSSLLKKYHEAKGILVSCPSNAETRALGQLSSQIEPLLLKLVPDAPCKPEYSLDPESLEIDLSFCEPLPENSRKEYKKKHAQFTDTGCGGVLFLQVYCKPTELVDRLFGTFQLTIEYLKLKENRDEIKRKFSFCHRFVPLDAVCSANTADIQQMATRMIQDLKDCSIAVIAESRNHIDLRKSLLKQLIFKCIPENRGITVDLEKPDFVLFISVFKSIAGFSILTDYYGRSKYNLQTIYSESGVVTTTPHHE